MKATKTELTLAINTALSSIGEAEAQWSKAKDSILQAAPTLETLLEVLEALDMSELSTNQKGRIVKWQNQVRRAIAKQSDTEPANGKKPIMPIAKRRKACDKSLVNLVKKSNLTREEFILRAEQAWDEANEIEG